MRAALTIVNVLLLGSGLTGCFDFLSNAQDFQQGRGGASGAGDAGGIGGTGSTSTVTSPPPECVPSGTSKAVDESCGIFISPGGSDATGDGTQKHPYATITKALSQGQVVYACADAAKPYDEAVTVDKQGTYIFGGLDCSTWIYNATNRTPLVASPGEMPLRIVGDAALEIEDFAITAADAPELMPGQHAAGASSIAIIAEAMSRLVMARCDVSAGRGAMGGHGEPPMGSAASGPEGEDGSGGCDADGELPGNGGQQVCGSTDVSGGLGGQGTKLSSGGKGSGGQPMGPLGLGGQPQPVAVTCDQGGNGGKGADGLAGEHGKGAAVDALGSLSAAGFLGTKGPDGMPGQPAQGGGGGGGARACLNGKAGPSGGGGGAGGCGGAGGKGGYPGGASIGIVSLGATLLFNNVTIKAGDGGNGGSGEGGQEGGAGGTGGVPGPGDSNAIACGGGKGGAGGAGGAGGGGLGGHSVGIAHSGATPSTEGTTIILGIPGDGGKGFGLLPEHNGASGVAKPVQGF